MDKATVTDVSSIPQKDPIVVMFNPTDLSVERRSRYASMPVPGLQTPILQYVRGQADQLRMELFLDATKGLGRRTVEDALTELRKFVTIDGTLHAPPVLRFDWGKVHFTGVVTSLDEKLTLFSEQGHAIRARVDITLRKYESAEVQLRNLKKSSPDRTHVRVVRDGERLTQLAFEAYGDPRHWRPIAEANDVDRPRFVPTGKLLKIPSL